MSHLLRTVTSILALGLIATAVAAPVRQAVPLPAAELLHERAIMRDHLAAMARIERDLSAGHWQEAAHVAQMHLGLSVMGTQGMQAMHRYMPAAMQHLGMQFHNASANLVVQIQNSGATGDMGPALHALAQVTSTCVACHTAYRFTQEPGSAPAVDTRTAVDLPDPTLDAALAIMRQHLSTLQSAQSAMSAQDWQTAAHVVQVNMLGVMGSADARAIHARMPEGMGQIAQAFQSSVSHWHAVLQTPHPEAAGALKAMADVTDTCVACHAAYRFAPESATHGANAH